MDELDMAIVRALQRDVRAPYAQIAGVVGADQSTVRRRLQAMLDAGQLNLFASASPGDLRETAHALVAVRTSPESTEVVASSLIENNDIVYVGVSSAGPTVWLSIVFPEVEHMYQFLSKELSSLPGVLSWEIHHILKVLKRRSAWAMEPREG